MGKRASHMPRTKLVEKYLEQCMRQKSQYTGNLIYKDCVDTLITLVTDVSVPPNIRLKATEIILKYQIGLPVQRVDVTTQGEKRISPACGGEPIILVRDR